MEAVITSVPKKSRRGNIFNSVRCHYLRNDIPCYHSSCIHCMNPFAPLKSEIFYILDYTSLLKYFSFLENQDFLTPENTIFLQGHLISLKKLDIKLYDKLKSFLQDKEFAIFLNEHHKETYLPLSIANRGDLLAEKVQNYYKMHIPLLNPIIISSDLEKYLQNSPLIDHLPMHFPLEQPIFEEHIHINQLIPLVKTGELYEGVLHILRNDLNKAWVSINKGVAVEFQVSVIGKNINRAIDGDIVAVEIGGGMELDNKIEIDEGVDVVSTGKSSSKILPGIEGRVVGIIKKKLKHYCGSIRRSGSFYEDKELCYFAPINPKIPEAKLFCKYPENLENKRILVEIDSWQSSSQLPQGHLVRVIGNISDLHTESEVILLEHDVIIKPFTQAALNCLPERDWKFSPEEESKRTDLRNRCVASVDPPGCKDIDDALHCAILPNGNYEIGVHIADVTYFVKANSALDLEASERCTTVYLVEKRTDMLPGILTEVLCSLVGNQDRLAFSVLWEIEPKTAKILNTKFCKSIIHSKASLSYQAAHNLIHANSNDELSQSLRRLLAISKILKQKRIENGALELASTEVKFELDTDRQGKDISLYQTYETNSMVEEFMLLANIAVADKIVESFPAYSILRRHPPPKNIELSLLSDRLKKLGYNLAFNTSSELASSLNSITSKDKYFNTLVRMQVTRCMNQAVYFCSSEVDKLEYRHYGLAAEIYTHFTSPIRRYADVLVHRLLSAAIDVESLPDTMTDRRIMGKICKRMNFRNRMSQFAERTSSNLHTYLVFKSKGNCDEEAIVTEIDDTGINVIVPKIGLEGSIELNGQPGDDKITWIMNDSIIKLYQHLRISIEISFENFRKTIKLRLLQILN